VLSVILCLSLNSLFHVCYASLLPSDIPPTKNIDIVFVTDAVFNTPPRYYARLLAAFKEGFMIDDDKPQNRIRIGLIGPGVPSDPPLTNSSSFFENIISTTNQAETNGDTLAAYFARAATLLNAQSDGYATPREKFVVLLATRSSGPLSLLNGESLMAAQSASRSLKYQGITVVVAHFDRTRDSTVFYDAEQSPAYYKNYHNIMSLASSPITGNYFLFDTGYDSNGETGAVSPSLISPIISRIRGDLGYTCSSFGAGHMTTFDGVPYDFQGLGVFELFQSTDLSINGELGTFGNALLDVSPITVQVQRGLCKSIFEGGGDKRVTCNRGVAFSSTIGSRINIFVDTEARDSGTIPNIQLWVTDPNFPNTIDNNTPYLLSLNTDFYNDGPFYMFKSHRGDVVLIKVTANIRSTKHGTLMGQLSINLEISNFGIDISIPAFAPLNGKTSGLCGLYDGNAANDFTNARGELIPPSTSNSDLDGMFGQTFRVKQSNSMFYQIPSSEGGDTFSVGYMDQTFINNFKGDYSGGGGGSCSNIHTTQASTPARNFLVDSCNNDGGAGLNTDNSPSYRMFLSLCFTYCETGVTPSSLISPSDCEPNVCTFVTPETRQDLHLVYDYYSPPPFEFEYKNDNPHMYFRPTINRGGRYDIILTTHDQCGDEQKNLSVNIVCPETLSPSITVLVPAGWTRETAEQGQMVLQADATGSSLPLSYSWLVVKTPDYFDPNGNTGPTPTPRFWPNPFSRTVTLGNILSVSLNVPRVGDINDDQYLYPGDYTIELAVTDGCNVKKVQSIIHVGCSLCPSSPVIVPYEGDFLTPADKFFSVFKGNTFSKRSFIFQVNNYAEGQDGYGPLVNVEWKLHALPQASPLNETFVTRTTNVPRIYSIVTQPSSTNYTTQITASGVIFNNTGPTTITPTTPPDYLYRPIDNGSPVQDFFYAKAATTVNDYEIQTTTSVSTLTIFTPSSSLCDLAIDSPFNFPANNPVTVFPVNWYSNPQNCVGFYNLSLQTFDGCNNVYDSLIYEVRCSQPVARLKCHNTLFNYSFASTSFPVVIFDASETYDSYFGSDETNLNFKFEGLSNNICGATSPCTLTVTEIGNKIFQWTPSNVVKSGDGQVRLTVDNGCLNNSDTISISFRCDVSTQAQAVISPSSPPPSGYDYTSGVYHGTVFSDVSTSIVEVSRQWNLVQTPSKNIFPFPSSGMNYFPVPPLSATVIYPSLTFNAGNATLNNLFPGSYSLSLTIDGGCSYSTATLNFDIRCDNLITLGFIGVGALSGSNNDWTITYGNDFTLSTNGTTTTQTTPSLDTYLRYFGEFNTPPAPHLQVPVRPSALSTDINIISKTLPITTTSQLVDGATYNVSVWIYDTKCSWDQQFVTVRYVCPTKNKSLFFSSVTPIYDTVYNPSNIFGVTYSFIGVFSGNKVTTSASILMTWVKTPPGSSRRVGDLYDTQNTTFIPDAPGDWEIKIDYNDGCGSNYDISSIPFNVPCPTYSPTTFSISPPSTTLNFDDHNCVRLTIDSVLSQNSIYQGYLLWSWYVISAPSGSVYESYDTTTLVSSSTLSFTTYDYINATASKTTVINETDNVYKRTIRQVTLDMIKDSAYYPNSTCFRPDIGGSYTIALVLNIQGDANQFCMHRTTASVSLTCGSHLPVLDSVIDQTVMVDRELATRVWLNASAVTDADSSNLIYNWRVVYPTASSLSWKNLPLPIPTIISPQSSTASFFVPQSNIDYIIELSVSDGCDVRNKTITIHSPCSLVVPLPNKTLAANYDGTVPVQLMSFGYDHSQEVSSYISSPKCQRYTWSFDTYSTSYSDSLYLTETTPFTKTSGFAGLISVVVIIAVVIPVIIWMYCTKKACFNKEGTTSGV